MQKELCYVNAFNMSLCQYSDYLIAGIIIASDYRMQVQLHTKTATQATVAHSVYYSFMAIQDSCTMHTIHKAYQIASSIHPCYKSVSDFMKDIGMST